MKSFLVCSSKFWKFFFLRFLYCYCLWHALLNRSYTCISDENGRAKKEKKGHLVEDIQVFLFICFSYINTGWQHKWTNSKSWEDLVDESYQRHLRLSYASSAPLFWTLFNFTDSSPLAVFYCTYYYNKKYVCYSQKKEEDMDCISSPKSLKISALVVYSLVSILSFVSKKFFWQILISFQLHLPTQQLVLLEYFLDSSIWIRIFTSTLHSLM